MSVFAVKKKTQKARFSLEELTRILIKALGVREGHWQVGVGFTASGTNLRLNEASPHQPAIVNVITAVELIEVAEPSPMSLDASQANPPVIAKPTASVM